MAVDRLVEIYGNDDQPNEIYLLGLKDSNGIEYSTTNGNKIKCMHASKLIVTDCIRTVDGNVGGAKRIAGDCGFKFTAISGVSAMDRIILPE